jgi:hypothetical protein
MTNPNDQRDERDLRDLPFLHFAFCILGILHFVAHSGTPAPPYPRTSAKAVKPPG